MKKNNFKERGQAVLFDLFFASLAILILIGAMNYYWEQTIKQDFERRQLDTMKTLTFQISSSLVESKGSPVNWEKNPNKVKVIGLLGNKIIDEEKLNALQGMDYGLIKEIMKISNYEFFLELNNEFEEIKIGLKPNGKTSINNSRIVLFKGQETILTFSLWRQN